MTNNIWTKVSIDPDLREFIMLSGNDIQDLSQRAAQQPDPVAWLTNELSNIGQKGRAEHEAHNRKRRDEDRAFFADRSRWPSEGCCVKEQPWVKANGRRFGRVFKDDFERGNWIVYIEGEASETFASLSELVEVWSVD